MIVNVILFIAFVLLVLLYFGMHVFGPSWARVVEWVRGRQEKSDLLIHWGRSRGLRVHEGYTMWHITDRFRANPGKTFFEAEKFMMESDMRTMLEGQSAGRTLWVYPIVGKVFYGSMMGFSRSYVIDVHRQTDHLSGHVIERNQHGNVRVFRGWCMEISTKRIPQNITLTKKFFRAPDMLDTESRDFEKTYDVHGMQDSMVLQLLDPAMMSLILDSGAAAVEISDASLVLYHTAEEPDLEMLEKYYTCGIKIAEQIDRNFPKAS